MIFSTFIGGGDIDIFNRVEVNSKGQYVLYGRSSSHDYPIQNGLNSEYFGTGLDLVVTILSTDGQELIYSSRFGGSGDDIAGALTLDSDDNILVGGMTISHDFPIVGGVKDSNTGNSAFIVKFSSDGSEIYFSTYLGGEGQDWVYSILISPNGNLIVTGHTSSTSLPLVNAIQKSHGGGKAGSYEDAYIMILNSKADHILYSSYFGGNGNDFGWALSLDQDNKIVLTGFSDSTNLDNSLNQAFGDSDLFKAEFAFVTQTTDSDNAVGFLLFTLAGSFVLQSLSVGIKRRKY